MSNEPPATPSDANPGKPKKPGRWRRRLIWVLAIAVVGILAFRLMLSLSLPAVLQKIAGRFDLSCTYQRMELNLLSGDAGIWGFQVAPKDGGDPVLQADYCHGNISVLKLLRGRLDVWRVEADGVQMNIERTADGKIPLLERFLSLTASAPAKTANATPAAQTGKEGKEIDLSSPLKVDALRLSHVRVHLRDLSLSPQLDATVAMDLRLSDLGSTARPARFEMQVACESLLDSLEVHGSGRSSGKTLDADWIVDARGLRLKSLSAYLKPLGIRPVASNLTLHAAGHLHTAAATANAQAFTGLLSMENLSANADEQEALALDHLTLDAPAIDTHSIHLGSLVLDGIRANSSRSADGHLRIAGVELVSAPPAPAAPTTQPMAVAEISTAQPSPISVLLAEPWRLDEIAVRNFTASFHDEAVTPITDLSIHSDELAIKTINHDPRQLDIPATLAGTLQLPGVIGQIKITGMAKPFLADKTFSLSVDTQGITPVALKPYLQQLGLESQLQDARFSCAVDGDLALQNSEAMANAKISNVLFHNGDGSELLNFSGVSVSGASLDTTTGHVGAQSIDITGPHLTARRDGTGALVAVGLRTHSFVSPPSTPLAATPATNPSFALNIPPLPQIEIQHFAWKNIQLDLTDEMASPAAKMSVNNAGVELTHFTTITGPSPQPSAPGHIHAWLAAPGVADDLSLDGDIVGSERSLSFNVQISGKNLTGTALAPYVAPLGIQPVLHSGALQAHAIATISQSAEALTVSLGADHVRYTDADEELAAVDRFAVDNLILRSTGIEIGSVQIEHPRAAVMRDADNSFIAAGIRLTLPKALVNSPSAASSSPLPASLIPTIPLAISLKQLHVQDAALQWTDRAANPMVNTTGTTTVDLNNLSLGMPGFPAQLKLTAQATGSADHILVTGTLDTSPASLGAKLDISADGLRLGPLAAYLPPGISAPLKNGTFAMALDAGISPNHQGGDQAHLFVSNLKFADDAGSTPLLKLDSFKVIAPRIDLPGQTFAFDEISSAGVETDIQKTSGGIAAMGLMLSQNTAPADSNTPALAAETESPPSTPQPVSTADLLAAAHRPLPLFTVEHLNLGVRRLSLSDATRPQSAPVVIRDLTFKNTSRIDLLGHDAASKPPTNLQLLCSIDPILNQLTANIAMAPFAQQPTLAVDVAASGVHGQGLTQLVPELKQYVDGSPLTDGQFAAHFEAQAKLDRHTPIDFDLSRGLDLDLLLRNVSYRAIPGGPVLAGVDEVRSDSIRIQPADSFVHAKSIEITNPVGLFTQDAAGVHVLGWVIKLPAIEAASTQPAAPAVAANPPAPLQPVATVPPTGEIRIDQLLISGLNARFEDTATNPPLIIPLSGLDVEVRDISTLAPYQDKPIRFSATLTAGNVRLPKHISGSGIAGALGDMGKLMSHQKIDATPVMEDRSLFSQITADGSISLYPTLHGWAKTSVSGLELAELEGPAKQLGVGLAGGIYDSTVDARFDPDGTIATTSKFVLTDLAVSEPPNGPIFRYLHLPAPLDVAVGAVQGADGAITLPVNLPIHPGHVSGGDIAASAAGAVSSVIVTAIASTPLKAVSSVGSIIGIAGPKPTAPEPATVIRFAPGSTAVDSAQLAALDPLLKRMAKDKSLTLTIRHELGGGDVQRAALRANPSLEDCRNLEYQLSNRKQQLLQLQAEVAGQARAQLLSSGQVAAGATLMRLKAIDQELGQTEDSLDEVGELLRPGADRQSTRRTRAASIAIGHARLDALRDLLNARLPGAGDRIKLIPAQFNPGDGGEGGELLVTAVKKSE